MHFVGSKNACLIFILLIFHCNQYVNFIIYIYNTDKITSFNLSKVFANSKIGVMSWVFIFFSMYVNSASLFNYW